jgi:GT2 family glycosyltransferase/SAM-dependent methyltransferase
MIGKTTIIIPTLNNMDYVLPCVRSIANNTVDSYRMIIVNQGSKEVANYITGDIDVLHSDRNLGWAGACNLGWSKLPDECEYVVLLNDDTQILPHDYDWLYKMRHIMENDPEVAAVGPASNVVAGTQHFSLVGMPAVIEPKFLIGFCVMMRRKDFEEIGLMDESLPGGDDFDWSIRFRKAGKKIVARRDVFVFHHGFKTGEKVHGTPEQENGWNSRKMQEETNMNIIRKHGFKWWLDTVKNVYKPYDINVEEYGPDTPFLSIAKGSGIDVGCGASKITPETIGIDLIPKGQETGEHGGIGVSEADLVASGDDLYMFDDGSLDYVLARHNLEHYANPIKTLREWYRVLKDGGRLGIALPDDTQISSIRLDKTHKHSFNREGLKDLLELVGFRIDELGGTANQWDIYALATKEVN